MADTLAEARASVHTAALAREDLLRRAIENEQVTDEELEAADLAHERAERILKLEEAKAVGAQQRAKLAQIDDLRKQASVLETNWNDSLSRLVAASEAVDDAKCALEQAVIAYYEAAKVGQAALTAGAHWNSLWLNYRHHHNELLRDLPSEKQPRVHLPRDGFYIPQVQVEMFQNVGANTYNPTRDVVHSLSGRIRLQFNRPIDRDKAA